MAGTQVHRVAVGVLRMALAVSSVWAVACSEFEVESGPRLRLARASAVTADQVLNAMTMTDTERADVKAGQMVTTSLTSSNNSELAVALAFTMPGAPADAAAKFRQSIYQGDPKVIGWGQISTPATLDDFKKLTLGPQGASQAQAFLHAAPGDQLNLSSQEIAAFAALNAQAPSAAAAQGLVEQQLRTMLLARCQAYRSGGLSAIAPYARADGRALLPGRELRDAANASVVLAEFAQSVSQLLIDYPQGKPANLDEAFYWVVFNIDSVPTVALSHRIWIAPSGGSLMVDRLYYVSSSFNTEQAIAGFLPVESGTMVFYTNRTSTDQVSGFGSSAKRAIGDHMMTSQLSATFQKLRGGN